MKVLKRLNDTGALDGVVVIGSWSLYFYRLYFKDRAYHPDIRTRDIDFLVPLPPKFKRKVDVPALLEELGFVINFRGSGGYIRLDHPELIVEFLIPEKGKGREKPYPLPQLGLNAQPLRYLDFLLKHTIMVEQSGVKLLLPHPAAHALHKLIVSGRRTGKDKAEKDRRQALDLLHYLLNDARHRKQLKKIFEAMHSGWQKTALKALRKWNENDLADFLN